VLITLGGCRRDTPTKPGDLQDAVLAPLVGSWVSVKADSIHGIHIDTTGTIRPLAVELSTGRLTYDRTNWIARLHAFVPDTLGIEYITANRRRHFTVAFHVVDSVLTFRQAGYPPLPAQATAVEIGDQVTEPVAVSFHCRVERQEWQADSIQSRSTSLFEADSIGPTVSAIATWSAQDTGATLTIQGTWNARFDSPQTRTVTLTLPNVDSVGTFPLGTDTTGIGSYWTRAGDQLFGGSTQHGAGRGRLTLTALDWTAGRCAGTFEFTTDRLFHSSRITYAVTNGHFDIPLRIVE